MRTKLVLAPIVAAGAALTIGGIAQVAAAGRTATVNQTAVHAAAGGGNQGKFSNVCFYSHSAFDDPIVFPGKPGVSHQHDFIGNNTTNANTTLASLQAGTTNCDIAKDLASYWVPTMLKGATWMNGMEMGGTPIHASSVTVYYLSNGKSNTKPYPLGLKEIAGNAHATSTTQEHNVYWGCSTTFPTLPSAPTCASGENLHVRVDFADCWDGKNLDSSDHVSHVAYSDGKGTCPSGFPVPIPELSLLVKYPTPGGSDITVASGPTYSMHGDFFNAWDPATLANLVTTCLDAGVKCGKP
jgi:hypothetical protein